MLPSLFPTGSSMASPTFTPAKHAQHAWQSRIVRLVGLGERCEPAQPGCEARGDSDARPGGIWSESPGLDSAAAVKHAPEAWSMTPTNLIICSERQGMDQGAASEEVHMIVRILTTTFKQFLPWALQSCQPGWEPPMHFVCHRTPRSPRNGPRRTSAFCPMHARN